MRKFEKISTRLEGVSIIRPRVFQDDRGFFLETYNKLDFAEIDINEEFVQDNLSHSEKGVVSDINCKNGNLYSAIAGWEITS